MPSAGWRARLAGDGRIRAGVGRWFWAVLVVLLLSVSVEVPGALGRAAGRAIVTSWPGEQAFVAAAGHDSLAMRVVFVASRNDCTGNFLLANVVAPRAVQRVIGVPELVLQGTGRDTIGLRSIVPYALRHSPMRLLSEDEKRFLHGLGHHATPVLLLYDRAGRLRLASQVDPDPVARVALSRALTHVVTLDPSH